MHAAFSFATLNRSYAPRFLRTMKKEKLLKLQPNGKSFKCNRWKLALEIDLTDGNILFGISNKVQNEVIQNINKIISHLK